MRSERGFTLVEILVALVILGILTAAFTSMSSLTSSQLKLMGAKMGKINLSQDIRAIITNPKICAQKLGGQILDKDLKDTPLKLEITQGVFIDGTDSRGTKLPQYDVNVNTFAVTGLTAAGSLQGKPLVMGTLSVSAQELGTKHDVKMRLQDVDAGKIYFQLGGATGFEILQCFGTGINDDLMSMMCQTMGGTFADGKCSLINGASCVAESHWDPAAQKMVSTYVPPGTTNSFESSVGYICIDGYWAVKSIPSSGSTDQRGSADASGSGNGQGGGGG